MEVQVEKKLSLPTKKDVVAYGIDKFTKMCRSDVFSFIKEWEKLPKEYQAALEAACYEANLDMMAEYDFKNPQALARLLKNGVKLHAYSTPIMREAQKAAFDCERVGVILAGYEVPERFYEIGSHAGLAELEVLLSKRV